MWVLYALMSAVFAGIMSILAKIGIKNVNSNLAAALRTIVVVIFAWLMVFVVGSQNTLRDIDAKSFVFLILSGCTTGGSWLFYFKALQMSDINKVVPIDKSSTVLTMLLSIILLGESITTIKICAIIFIGAGTFLMIERKEGNVTKGNVNTAKGYQWLLYAILSAVFASLTAILGKIGIADIESNLGTAIRTVVVLILSWLIVFWQKKEREITNINRKNWIFIVLSGLATGSSWLCYYRALQEGPASVVVPIDKLSILITIAFSSFILHEKLTKKAAIGLITIVFGTLLLLL